MLIFQFFVFRRFVQIEADIANNHQQTHRSQRKANLQNFARARANYAVLVHPSLNVNRNINKMYINIILYNTEIMDIICTAHNNPITIATISFKKIFPVRNFAEETSTLRNSPELFGARKWRTNLHFNSAVISITKSWKNTLAEREKTFAQFIGFNDVTTIQTKDANFTQLLVHTFTNNFQMGLLAVCARTPAPSFVR